MSARGELGGMGRMIRIVLRRPHHLQLALWLLATLLYGAVAGVLLNGNPYVAGTVITAVWLAATWRGLHSLPAGAASAIERSQDHASGDDAHGQDQQVAQ